MMLPLYEIILISIGLGSDAFSAALAAGAQGFTPRRIFRLAWHFGLFQFMMPVIGWFVGGAAAKYIGGYGHWFVLLLLAGIGLRMIIEGFKNNPGQSPDLSRGLKMVGLAIGTSLDALGVGFGFGLMEITIWRPAVIIGVICMIMTTAGLYLGTRLYRYFGQRAMIIGGLILIAIGLNMVL